MVDVLSWRGGDGRKDRFARCELKERWKADGRKLSFIYLQPRTPHLVHIYPDLKIRTQDSALFYNLLGSCCTLGCGFCSLQLSHICVINPGERVFCSLAILYPMQFKPSTIDC